MEIVFVVDVQLGSDDITVDSLGGKCALFKIDIRSLGIGPADGVAVVLLAGHAQEYIACHILIVGTYGNMVEIGDFIVGLQ